MSVWVDSTGLRSGVDFLSKIGQAIIDAKLFVSLVSEKSLKSKFCRDELSLAYISDKFLFPVALDSLTNLVDVMDTGMLWSFFINEVNSPAVYQSRTVRAGAVIPVKTLL